jgi:hypothetical protein
MGENSLLGRRLLVAFELLLVWNESNAMDVGAVCRNQGFFLRYDIGCRPKWSVKALVNDERLL